MPVNIIKQGKNGKKYYLDDSEPNSDDDMEEEETELSKEDIMKLALKSFPNLNKKIN